MQYRKLGRTGVDISAVSLGAEHLVQIPYEDVKSVIDAAIEGGMNYVDIFMPEAEVRDFLGRALKGRRDRMMVAGHLGQTLTADGQYMRTRDLKLAEAHAEDFLRRVGGDAIDMFMIHFVDEVADAEECLKSGGLLDIALRWKREGKARFVGLSSHVPSAARRLVETGKIDGVLFTVNPLHDTLGNVNMERLFEDESYAAVTQGRSDERRAFFEACRRYGTAVISMKTYAAGRLLAPQNPLGVQLTPVQCLHYTLSQAGVCSAAVGCRNPGEVRAALAYLDAMDEERDFSVLSGSKMFAARGACMYCNHCLPCPVEIDIAEATRILDAAKGGMTETLREAYKAMKAGASACIACGACAKRCPFGVDAPGNMKALAGMF